MLRRIIEEKAYQELHAITINFFNAFESVANNKMYKEKIFELVRKYSSVIDQHLYHFKNICTKF